MALLLKYVTRDKGHPQEEKPSIIVQPVTDRATSVTPSILTTTRRFSPTRQTHDNMSVLKRLTPTKFRTDSLTKCTPRVIFVSSKSTNTSALVIKRMIDQSTSPLVKTTNLLTSNSGNSQLTDSTEATTSDWSNSAASHPLSTPYPYKTGNFTSLFDVDTIGKPSPPNKPTKDKSKITNRVWRY